MSNRRMKKGTFGLRKNARVTVSGQGTQSKPVPPAKPTLKYMHRPVPKPVNAPGASGTI